MGLDSFATTTVGSWRLLATSGPITQASLRVQWLIPFQITVAHSVDGGYFSLSLDLWQDDNYQIGENLLFLNNVYIPKAGFYLPLLGCGEVFTGPNNTIKST